MALLVDNFADYFKNIFNGGNKVKDSKLLVDIKPTLSCDYHRIMVPLDYGTLRSDKEVLFFNRNSTLGRFEVEEMKAKGYKIVVDVDDFWNLPTTHYLYPQLNKYMSSEIPMYIRMADVVMASTPELAYQVMKINKNVVVVPNGLPFDKGQFTRSGDILSQSLLVYVAGASHRNDSKMMGEGAFGNSLTLAGYEENHPEWKKIKSYFPEAKYKMPKKSETYMTLYDGHKVAVAPLVEDGFNICKSNLKVLEAGAKGIPIICSPSLPYLNIKDKDVVLFAEDPSQWTYLADKLRKDSSFYVECATQLATHVREHYQLSESNKIRQQVFDSF